MEEAFDPYEHWLGIPPAEQPPNYYRLLGIRPGEGDVVLIGKAYQLRMDHVQLCDDGTYPEAAMRLREHLMGARQVLLDPELKRQYDGMILPAAENQADGGSGGPSVEAERPAADDSLPKPDEPESFLRSRASLAGAIPSPPAALQATSPVAQAWLSWLISIALAIVVAVPILLFLTSRIGSSTPRPANGSGNADSPGGREEAPARSLPSAIPGKQGSPSAGRSPRPGGPQTLADLMGQADDAPADLGSVTGLLDAARRAMAGRDLATAGDHIEAAVELAQSPTEQASVRRIATLHRAVEAFWKAVEAEASRLRGGEELPVGDTRVIVVEAGGGELLIRMQGENRRYALEDLPWQLALPLAERAMPRNSPATHMAIGSFLAVDPRGDRIQAIERLRLAGAEGRELLAELGLSAED